MIQRNIILTACSLAIGIATLHSQHPAAPDAALSALIAKYQADVKAMNNARDGARTLAKKNYLTALDDAEAKVSAAGNTDGLKAVVEEKQTIAGGGAFAPQPNTALPRDLINARSTYLRETAQLGQSTAPRLKQLQGDYLRNLAAMEVKARSIKNQPLIDQVVAEKLKLAGQTVITAKDAVNPTTMSQLDRWLTNGKHKWYWKGSADAAGDKGSVIEFLADKTMTLGNRSRWEIVDLRTLKLAHQGRVATLKFDESYTTFTVDGWVSGKRFGELVK